MAAGRPAYFDTEIELQAKIDEYLVWLQGDFKDVQKRDEEGDPYTERIYLRHPEQPTITGLAIYLGFESRQSIYDYEKNGEFSYTIKRARLFIENAYEKELLGKGVTGAIFALKNFGWADKQEVDHTTKGQSFNDKADLSKLTDEELRIRAEIDRKSYGA